MNAGVKRGVFDVLRRGLDNAIANWQITLIRFLEAFLFIAVTVVGAIAILAPIFVSIGFNLSDFNTPDDVAEAMASLLQKWILFLWVLVGILVLLLVFVLIHSFVSAGCARVFVDADRMAGTEITGARSRYRLFSVDRWLAGSKEGWWPVFWIYNIIWGFAGLLMLIPLVPTIIAMFALRGNEAAAVLVGCFGLLFSIMFIILLTIVAGIWSNRAVAEWAVRRSGARDAVDSSWDAIRGDFGRHILAAAAIVVVAMAGSAFFAGFSFFAGMGEAMTKESGTFLIVTLPLRLVASVVNSAFSAAIGSWYLATYSALAMDRR